MKYLSENTENKVRLIRFIAWVALGLGLVGLIACSDDEKQDWVPNAAGGGGGTGGVDIGVSGASGATLDGGLGGNPTGSGGAPVAGAGGSGSNANGLAGTGGVGSVMDGAASGLQDGGGENTAGTGGAPADAGGSEANAGSAAGGGGTGEAPPVIDDDDLVVAPDGVDGAPGTLAEPTTLTSAISRVAPGGTVYLRGGVYSFNERISIAQNNSGSADEFKTMRSYYDEDPILDFSLEPRSFTNSGDKGVQLSGSYWHIIGITVENAADNGIFVGGSNNIIEGCTIRGNGDTGLQISQSGSAPRPSNNLILNCESYDNDDSSGENADGFASKLTSGPGNVFRGCVAHHNADDGWDLWTNRGSPIDPVTIDQCIAHHNGRLTDGTVRTSGDRNGFKLGGASVAVAHIVTRSIAFANGAVGFTWNSNPGAIRLINNLSFNNAGGNYYFGSGSQAVYTNNVSFWTSSGGRNDTVNGNDVSNSNCFWIGNGSACGNGIVVAADDFANPLLGFVDPLGNPAIDRTLDDSLDVTPFSLSPTSDLINAGVMPGGQLPFDATYYNDAPDLGAVER